MSLPSLILSFLSFLQLATGFVTKIFRSNYALLSHVIRNYKMLPLVHIAFDKEDNHHRGPLFFLPLTLWFCYENRFIKCSLILSSETLTLLYFALGIRSQCCMLHALKSEVFTREGGGGGRLGDSDPSFWIFWIRALPPFCFEHSEPIGWVGRLDGKILTKVWFM